MSPASLAGTNPREVIAALNDQAALPAPEAATD